MKRNKCMHEIGQRPRKKQEVFRHLSPNCLPFLRHNQAYSRISRRALETSRDTHQKESRHKDETWAANFSLVRCGLEGERCRGQLPSSVSDTCSPIAIPGTLGQGCQAPYICHCNVKTGPIWSMQDRRLMGLLASGLGGLPSFLWAELASSAAQDCAHSLIQST